MSVMSLASSAKDQLIAQVLLDLCEGGTLANRLPGYQQRPAQLTLARNVAEALANQATFIGEAGTGTGKSLSYLIPLIRSGVVAVVSTGNKALQEQLFFKDIPFLQTYIEDFEAALMKGMGNYACHDRIEMARKNPDLDGEEAFQRVLSALTQPAFNGDLETLSFALPAEIRSRVNGDSDQCAGKMCDFYASCYVYAMRERVKQARLIVVNHTLLLLDAALNHALLPEHDVRIIDEAHHLEAEATSAFTLRAKPGQIYAFLHGRLVQDHTSPALRETVKALNVLLWQQVEHLPFNASTRLSLAQPIPEALILAGKLEELLKELRVNRPANQDEKAIALYDKLLERTDTLARTIRQVFTLAKTGEWIYYVEREARANGNTTYQGCMAPLTVARFLQEKLFDKPTVLVSATLATEAASAARTGRSPFAYFRERVGLAETPVQECMLHQPFDYERHALLYLPSPRTLPEPLTLQSQSIERAQVEHYLRAVSDEMWHLVQASRGRAFLLFSSRHMLDECYLRLAQRLAYPLFRQGDLPRTELVRRFKAEQGAVLFGLKSFWEGVDIPGDALSLVVVDRLPFAPPNDPVDQGRVKTMKEQGQDWFGGFILPRAIIDLKQGMGRLLRTDTDYGVFALLDTRLTTRGYGSRVLAELPPAPRTHSLDDVRAFFRALDAAGQGR